MGLEKVLPLMEFYMGPREWSMIPQLSKYYRNYMKSLRPVGMQNPTDMALAAAEGLELVTAANATGYKGVFLNQAGKYEARIREGGKQVYLGIFVTAEEAALAYAQHAGPERVAEEAAAARCEGPKPLTAAEALAAAAAERLELVTATEYHGRPCLSGYKGVCLNNDKYKVAVKEGGKTVNLGRFITA